MLALQGTNIPEMMGVVAQLIIWLLGHKKQVHGDGWLKGPNPWIKHGSLFPSVHVLFILKRQVFSLLWRQSSVIHTAEETSAEKIKNYKKNAQLWYENKIYYKKDELKKTCWLFWNK